MIIQNATKVAEIGGATFPNNLCGQIANWSREKSWEPSTLLIGRYLCWAFYRDQRELLSTFPELESVFEEAVRAYGPWGELLSGAYRAGSKCNRLMLGSARLRNGKGPETAVRIKAGTKTISKYFYFGLRVDNLVAGRSRGPEQLAWVWEGKNSIDGTTGLCANEVLLYWFIAKGALTNWLGITVARTV